MNSVTLELKDNKTQYRPGETLSGVAEWSLSEVSGGESEVHLLWYTEGQGTQDSEITETEHFGTASSRGRREFSFRLPTSPYSYSGTLLSILWAVEFVIDGVPEVARIEFSLSPQGNEEITATEGWRPDGM